MVEGLAYYPLTASSALETVPWVSYSIPHRLYLVSDYAYEAVHEISNNVVCATSKDSDQPAHKRSLI